MSQRVSFFGTALFIAVIGGFLLLISSSYANAGTTSSFEALDFFQDTSSAPIDTLRYPISDRRADALSSSGGLFNSFMPSTVSDSVVYDYETRRYIIYEKIGTIDPRSVIPSANTGR
jgi:hypothetical protein